MELKEIVAPTMKELFINEIERKILSGEWAINDRLPSEREMEKKMKVSRTIINSGLTILAERGFIKIIPRQGTFVNDYIKNGNLDTLVSIMNFNDGRLDHKTFDSLMMYRTKTDCECAYLAALNRDEDDLLMMLQIYNKLKDNKDINEIIELKIEFEHVIYCATKNTIYPLLCNSFYKLNRMFSDIIFSKFGYRDATLFFPELIDAIQRKDADSAKNFMERIMDHRTQQLNEYYYK